MIALMSLSIIAALGCGGEEASETELTVDQQCQQAIEKVAQCYPGVSFEAECNEATLASYQEYGMDGQDCDDVKKTGKADWFSFGGCGVGEHECGLIFCCKNYDITWWPEEAHWDIVPVVETLRAATPATALATIEQATREELLTGVAATYQQEVAEYAGGGTKEMAVELSVGITDVPYEAFSLHLSAELWGVKLAHYLGGEVIVYEKDGQQRATRQLERMSLSPFPCDWEVPLTNMDMTKVEVIQYEEDRAIVYWRVMFSDNDSTETDVGYVEFKRYDETATQITFQSAHRLNAPGGIHIPNDVVEFVLKTFFVEHINHYGDIVRSYL